MGPFSFFGKLGLRGMGVLAIAAAFAPLVFFGVLALMALGLIAFNIMPVIFMFVGWTMLTRHLRRAREEAKADSIIEARILREEAPEQAPPSKDPPYPVEAYTPPVHFDLLLAAKGDIGRLRGAAKAMRDGAVARQFTALADRADAILGQITAQPAKLGLARRFFSSYLPRAADLADGSHALFENGAIDQARRAKLLDVLYRLEAAMKEAESGLNSPELSRLDADMKILTEDLRHLPMPNFKPAPEPILTRVDEIVKSAKTARE